MLLDPFHELGAGGPEVGMVGEEVNQCIRIEKDRRSRRDLGESYVDSRMLYSSPSATRWSSSGSPFHWSSPDVRSAQLNPGSIVIRTTSCSLSGNGRVGLRTPFS